MGTNDTEKIISVIRDALDQLGVSDEEVKPNTKLGDVADSLDLVELRMSLEKELSKPDLFAALDDHEGHEDHEDEHVDLLGNMTLAELVRYVQKHC